MNLGFPVAAVAAGGADAAELGCFGPPSDGCWIDAECRGHLSRGRSGTAYGVAGSRVVSSYAAIGIRHVGGAGQ